MSRLAGFRPNKISEMRTTRTANVKAYLMSSEHLLRLPLSLLWWHPSHVVAIFCENQKISWQEIRLSAGLWWEWQPRRRQANIDNVVASKGEEKDKEGGGRETEGCCHNNWQAEQQQQRIDEAKAYAAMRVSSCRLSPCLVCLCVLHIERGRHSARQDATEGVNEDDGDSDKVAQTMCSATCQAKQIVRAATRRCLSMTMSLCVCVWACVSDCVCVLGR